MDKTTVTYLGHSAWIVETPDLIYVFDYDKTPRENRLVDLDKLQAKPVYFFASHTHGDHYSARLNEAVSQRANMKFITGGFKSRFSNSIAVYPRESIKVSDISVTTAASTDIGVCYLVERPGLTVFHSGDLANWPDNEDTPVDYFEEIDYIASRAGAVDIAFIPVTTFDWYQDKCLLDGAVYAIKKLNPSFVFPMHGNGREDLYRKFAKYASDNGVTNSIICMESPGRSWVSPGSGVDSDNSLE